MQEHRGASKPLLLRRERNLYCKDLAKFGNHLLLKTAQQNLKAMRNALLLLWSLTKEPSIA